MMLASTPISTPQFVPDGWLEIAARLGLALVIGAASGWERERSGRAAGLRTYMTVALGSAGFTLLGIEMLSEVQSGDPVFRYDASRVIAGIVTGIGFLGAGTIIQSGGKVTGLTTAAGLWAIAAAGAASGAGEYALAILLTVFTVFVIAVLKAVEHRWISSSKRDGDVAADAPP